MSEDWAGGGPRRAPRRAPGRPGRPDAIGPSPAIGLVALMWLVFAAEVVYPANWMSYGLVAGDLHQWWGIFTAPLLHAGLAHILGNSVPLLALGALVCLHGHRAFWRVILASTLVGGVLAWVLTPAGTAVVGASGLVFGCFAYLVVDAFSPGPRRWTRRLSDIGIAVLVIALYGSAMVAGILDAGPSVSWQMHLGGAIGGAGAAVSGAGRRGVD